MSNFLLGAGKGYLTYIMALGAIIFGAYGLYTGQLDSTTAYASIWAGLTAFGIRRAM